MGTLIGIGFDQSENPLEAAQNASIQAKNELNATECDLAIIFTTIGYAQSEVIAHVKKILKAKHITGCSSAGIILTDHIQTKGIGILAITSDEIHFSTSDIDQIGSRDLREAGFALARTATTNLAQSQRQAFIFFVDSLFKNNTMFVRGAQEVLGNGFPIIGAVSSDDFSFKKTYQFSDKGLMTNAASGFLLSSQMNVVLGSKHGWRPLGKPRTIDQVDGNIIRMIDGKPAAHIYEEYLGQDAKEIASTQLGSVAILYPLGIYIEEEREYLLRNAVDILPDGSIVCQGEVPVDSEVHIMIGNKDSCKRAAYEAARIVQDGLFGRQAKLILIFESMTRLKVLSRLAFQEIQIIKEVLGYTTPLFGMYSYGEISPFRSLQNIKNTHLQNESIVILAIG